MRLGASAVVLLLVFCTSTVAHADATSGTLVARQGDVRVMLPGAAEAAAQEGQALPPGTHVRTGVGGSAEVRFADGSVLKMESDSQLQLSAVNRAAKKTAIVMFFGRIWSKVMRAGGDATTFDIKTPNATCGVRGTEFTTMVANDGSARVSVQDGQVVVAGDASSAQVGPLQQVEASDGGVASVTAQGGASDDASWSAAKTKRLQTETQAVVDRVKTNIAAHKNTLDGLRAQQEAAQSKLDAAMKSGDAAQTQVLAQKLASLGDRIADLGDQATSSFGLVEHFIDVARDSGFSQNSRDFLQLEAASLRKVKFDVDKMVQAGADMSARSLKLATAPSLGARPLANHARLSAAERMANSRAVVEAIRAKLGQALETLQAARQARDVAKVNFITEKTVALKGLMRIAQQADVNLQQALIANDEDAAAHEEGRLSISQGRTEQVAAETLAFVGDMDVYTGGTRVEMTVSGDSLKTPPIDLATLFPPIIGPLRPPPASPYQ